MKITASCHCGAVKMETAHAPETVTACNCSICRRLGALWAYAVPAEVRFVAGSDATDTYAWGDRSLAFHRCKFCGCLTHWSPLAKDAQRMAVNARLFAPDVLAQLRVRHFDGAESWRYLD